MSLRTNDDLPPGQQLAAPGKWPVVGEKSPGEWPAAWTIEVAGLVQVPTAWALEQLQARPLVERSIDVHCVTRWSKPAVRFRGLPLAELIEGCRPLPEARYVRFLAYSSRNHSTSLPLDDCRRLDVLVALESEGRPLAVEHGGPVRIVTPGKYFYKSIKWLKGIELLAEDRLGYWEAEAGYHNEADPWREQRYLASSIDRREAAALIAARDFGGRDLRGLQASGRDLDDLRAEGALLRDADFRRASLRRAVFDRANLSNAHCEGAVLRDASLRDADLEGANLEGADLRGADLRGASLFGATFIALDGTAALIDHATRIDAASIEQLTPVQAEFMLGRKAI